MARPSTSEQEDFSNDPQAHLQGLGVDAAEETSA